MNLRALYSTALLAVTALSLGACGEVSPGFTHSEMVDPYVESAPATMAPIISRHSAMRRLGDAEEIAESIAWLCSDAAPFVNGVVLTVDGGDASRLY